MSVRSSRPAPAEPARQDLLDVRENLLGRPTKFGPPRDTDGEGRARQQLAASAPGQYRLSYKVTDSRQHTIEGGYLFLVRGQGFDGSAYRFNALELVTDKREYAPGDRVKLLVNTNQKDGVVLLFVRPTNGVYFYCVPHVR